MPHRHDPSAGEYPDPNQGEIGFLESRRVASDAWRITFEDLPHPRYTQTRYTIHTPGGKLTTTLRANAQTAWVAEHLIKRREDIELIAQFATAPKCDVNAVNAHAEVYGERGIVRGHIPCFDIFGQPGCWQDAA